MRGQVALDANLLLLHVVGDVQPSWIGQHKRLQAFDDLDFHLLRREIGEASVLVTPNALTEASNLLPQGVQDPLRSELMGGLASFARGAAETYLPSSLLSVDPAFTRLGLTDTAWLVALEHPTLLMTVDLDLYLEALSRGLNAVNFNHLRDQSA